MKIALVNHGIYPDMVGGMEKHTYELAKHLQSSGVEVHVLIPEPKTATSYPFPVHHLPWPKRPFWLWSNYEFTKHVGEWIDRNRPDIAFGQGFNLWAYLSRKKIPCIFHPHGLEMFGTHLSMFEKLMTAPFRILVRYHGRHSDFTVSLGGRLTPILETQAGITREKIREIPNAVVVDEYQNNSPRTGNRILFVGRLAFNKGIDFLPDVLLRCADLRFTLTIVGNGPARPQVEALAKQDPRVQYKGNLENPMLREVYAQHDALIFMSRFEGMPTVILEAMASGCSVIATRIGAVETMIDTSTGILVEPNAESIAFGIRQFLNLTSSERERIRTKGNQQVIQQFDWPKVIPRYLSLFSELAR